MVFDIAEVDRAVEIALRNQVVKMGYWPDPAPFLANDDNEGFEAAKAAMIEAGVPLIQVYGTGAGEDRGELMANNIIIDRKAAGFGDTAFAQGIHFEQYTSGGSQFFRKVKTAEITNDFGYEIRFLAEDIALDRVISRIIMGALSVRTYLYGIKEDLTVTNHGFWFMSDGASHDLSGEDYLERMWRYTAKDVVATPSTVLKSGISPIKTIEVVVTGSENVAAVDTPENIAANGSNETTVTVDEQ
jgi:hypothetical protein